MVCKGAAWNAEHGGGPTGVLHVLCHGRRVQTHAGQGEKVHDVKPSAAADHELHHRPAARAWGGAPHANRFQLHLVQGRLTSLPSRQEKRPKCPASMLLCLIDNRGRNGESTGAATPWRRVHKSESVRLHQRASTPGRLRQQRRYPRDCDIRSWLYPRAEKPDIAFTEPLQQAEKQIVLSVRGKNNLMLDRDLVPLEFPNAS